MKVPFLKYLYSLAVIACFAIPFGRLNAETPFKSISDSAAVAYKAGQYYYAIDLYDSILNQGYASAALYYNLGNAYFKIDKMPMAILYYEKARRLAPSDEDLIHNISLANSLITDKIDEIPLLFYQRWWHSLYSLFPADTWAIITLVSLFLFFTFLAFYLVSNIINFKKLGFSLALIFFVLTIFTFIFASKQYKHSFKAHSAIVFSPRITAKSSPDENSIDLFVIHEGTKVSIQYNLGDWCEIKLANGNVGWIKRDLLKPI